MQKRIVVLQLSSITSVYGMWLQDADINSNLEALEAKFRSERGDPPRFSTLFTSATPKALVSK